MPSLARFFVPQVFDDDSWKHCAEPKRYIERMTRAEMQAAVNRHYSLGQIDIREWRRVTDELSEPSK